MASLRKHILPPKDLDLPRTIHDDRHKLENVQVPIVTVSASFRSDIAKGLGEHAREEGELAFSRAHFSMALAVYEQAKEKGLSSWLVDPVNYLGTDSWANLEKVEHLGKLIARSPILKKVKDILDSVIRSKSPLTKHIEEPLEYVTARASSTIISLHYEAGNLLAKYNRNVLQVVTDPHVRPHYLQQAERKNISFAVFDEQTKKQFLELAKKLNKDVSSSKVVVTGPPVDPRVVKARLGKKSTNYKKRGLRLAITTSGLGTNFGEIKDILETLVPVIEEKNIELLLYASTHEDFKFMFCEIAQKHGIKVSDEKGKSRVRVIHDESLIVANQRLIDTAFSWADGFITKPSGDMAYDALAAGCFVLTLAPWGEWEEKIFDKFSQLGVAKAADTTNIVSQIEKLSEENWFEQAIDRALNVDKLFLSGAKNIVDFQQKLASSTT